MKKLGFKRVVLARELSFEQIKYIADNTDVEIEIFAHGALCVSYSGQCLMSSMIGDRSGNRGKCAGPCRLPYSLLQDDKTVGSGYLLSPKDLSMIDVLDKIPNVKSLKLEGRMKSPEYVATITRVFRKYIDEYLDTNALKINAKDKLDLAQIFNRGGFSTAYLFNKTGRDMMCYEKPKNWGVYVGKVKAYDGKRYITLDDASKISIGDGIEVWNSTNESPSTIVSEIIGNKIGRIFGKINVGDKVYKTSDKALNTTARESFSRGFVKHSKIDVKISIHENSKIKMRINDFDFESDVIPEESKNNPLTKDAVAKQLSKTGSTPFAIDKLEIDLGESLFVPVSSLNEIRRNALLEYEKFLVASISKTADNTKLPKIKKHVVKSIDASTKREVSVFFNELKEDFLDLKNIDNAYFTIKDAVSKLDIIKKFDAKKYIVLPTVTTFNYKKLIERQIENLAKSVDGFVLSNISQLEFTKNLNCELIANYTFNTFNSYAIELLHDLGFSKVILSPELSKNQIDALGSSLPREAIVYGSQVVMTSEYCPIGSILGGKTACKDCTKPCISNEKYYLKDRMNMKFRVVPDNINCTSQIFNAKITSIESKNLNVDSVRIDILDETLGEIQNIIDTHMIGNKLSGEHYTNGHMNRPV